MSDEFVTTVAQHGDISMMTLHADNEVRTFAQRRIVGVSSVYVGIAPIITLYVCSTEETSVDMPKIFLSEFLR